MTDEQNISAQELEEFRRYKEQKAREEQRKALQSDYVDLVDNEIGAAYVQLSLLSTEMAQIKRAVFDNFRSVIEMKTEQLGLGKEEGQKTHTFTNSDSTLRLTLGNYTVAAERDTVDEGIRMVTADIESLAKDDATGALVSAVLRLLSRNKAGQIKASRVLQLRRLAEESGSEQFLNGVKLIEESYHPQVSKSFVRIEAKDADTGEWQNIPLSLSGV